MNHDAGSARIRVALREGISAAVLCLFALLTGCITGGKPASKAVSTPPPPAPVAPPATPAPPPQPLSIYQTQVQLPAPQEISAEALSTTQVPEPPVEPPAGQRAVRRPPAPAARTEPAPPAAPPPAEAEQRETVQEIVPPGESKRLQDSAEARKQEVRKLLNRAQARPLNREQRALIVRIESFLQLSDEAVHRGDMRQADALAQTAQVLARDLPNGR